ncbi:MAG: iron-sulfur cluster assembly accessory protein [Bacteroidetes bacterium]|nr:MAG: iron-sulfur cluster assembly accessory protein [Bacteroidota bacterium]
MKPLLYFTDAAINQIQALRKALHIQDNQYLRVGVRGGSGCMAVTQVIAFDEKEERDELYDVQGMPVLVRKGESMYILGMTVDYVDDGQSKGFVFSA